MEGFGLIIMIPMFTEEALCYLQIQSCFYLPDILHYLRARSLSGSQ